MIWKSRDRCREATSGPSSELASRTVAETNFTLFCDDVADVFFPFHCSRCTSLLVVGDNSPAVDAVVSDRFS